MNLLLDTHVYLWCRSDPSRLTAKERAAIRDSSNELLLSVASAWEIEIKRALGKLELPDDWMDATAAFGVQCFIGPGGNGAAHPEDFVVLDPQVAPVRRAA